MIKVLFIIQDEKLPSSRIRIINLLPELEKEGINADVVKYPRGSLEKIRLIKMCNQFDMTFLQKKLLSPIDAVLLRKYARKLIFDFDDAIYYRHDEHRTVKSRSRYLKFKFLVSKVDLVVAGNRILADYASRFNRNVVVIPSAVETRNIPLKDYQKQCDKTIIGWVGGEVNLPHLGLLTPVLRKLSLDHRIQLRILSSRGLEIPSIDVNFVPWSADTQENEIALFDIGVMPLPNNKYTEGKCGYKVLQYMAASVPPVCSDVGINRDIIEDGKDGFVISSIDMFYGAIKTLIEDKALRQNMGTKAREKVEGRFSIQVAGKRLADLLIASL